MKIDELYLLDIIEAASDIQIFLKDIEEERFMLDRLMQSAVLFKLAVIGQSAAKVNQGLKDKYDDIPWDEMMAYSDFLQNPQGISNDKVWTSAVVDIADIQYSVRDVLKNEFSR